MDEVKPGARRTIDALVLVFGRVIAILQPVLDPLVSDGTGENDWAAHRAILGRPSLFEIVQSQLGCAAYASGAAAPFKSRALFAHLGEGDLGRAGEDEHTQSIPPI